MQTRRNFLKQLLFEKHQHQRLSKRNHATLGPRRQLQTCTPKEPEAAKILNEEIPNTKLEVAWKQVGQKDYEQEQHQQSKH